MEVKKFGEYNDIERKELLMHWWYYYGKLLVSLAEYEEFERLVDEDSSLMMDVAVMSFLVGESSQMLIGAMRQDKVNEYLDLVRRMKDEEYFKKIEEDVQAAFIEEVVGTYNSPEPDIPMTQEQILNSLVDLVTANNNSYIEKESGNGKKPCQFIKVNNESNGMK